MKGSVSSQATGTSGAIPTTPVVAAGQTIRVGTALYKPAGYIEA